jgi:cytochrome c oxidase cbb3-type subunit 3
MRFGILLFAAAMSLSAQQPPHGAGDQKAAASLYMSDAAAIKAGEESYKLVCSGCHGISAEGGRGPNLITGRNVRRSSDEELFDIIKIGIAGSDMPPSPLPDGKVWQITAYVRNLSAPAYKQPLEGDPVAGKAVYYGKAGCANCHMIRGEGGYLGPDLTNIGMTSNLAQLREGVLEVNKRFSPGFRPVVVTTKAGEQIKGVAKNNSNYSLQLLDGKGKLHLINKRELKDANFQEKSWMPANYGERLSEQEQNDLFAFLAQQTIRVPDESSSEE